MKYYAHSGKSKGNFYLPPQLYVNHVINVRNYALKNVEKMLKKSTFYTSEIQSFIEDAIHLAALYHDMGKLDEHLQPVLSLINPPEERLLNHVDAGTAFLLKKFKETEHEVYLVAAFFVLSHHIGLQNWYELIEDKKPLTFFDKIKQVVKKSFRCQYNLKEEYGMDIDLSLEDYTDSMLDKYCKIQHQLVPEYRPKCVAGKIPLTSFQLRMAFSCLVDADHQDTSNHFSKNKYLVDFPKLKSQERLEYLDKSVQKLAKNKKTSSIKRRLRNELYLACGTIPTNRSYYLIDATVGNAKTVSSIKAALTIARERGQERIYSVAPFTNIIDQTVQVYRDNILLPQEPSHTINEIHSKLEFETPSLRMYNNIWNAPVNVTTAVQFIESLVKHYTSSVRKIHLFANSVIILDEFHNFIPHEQWNFILEIMRDLAQNFNTVFIFCSGSSVLYWELYEKRDMDVFEVVPSSLYQEMMKNETVRVNIVRIDKLFESLNEFSDHVMNFLKQNNRNSTMIVVNTIINSLVLTKHFQSLNSDYEIFHLSSFLTPEDRRRILKTIQVKLKKKKKLILIATSIAECGIDISFESGYRQVSSLASIIQFNGRINREQLNTSGASTMVFDFDKKLRDEKTLTENPMFLVGKEVLQSLTDDQLTPEYCTQAILMERELRQRVNDLNYFLKLEFLKCFKTVGTTFHVINAHTITVIVNSKISSDMRSGKFIPYWKIMNHSIQLWANKLEDIRFGDNIEIITVKEKEYYVWKGPYDPIFGIGVVI